MLTSQRLYTRVFKADDMDLLYHLHSNPEVAITTIDGIQTRDQIQNHLNNFISHQQKYGYSQFAVFEKDTDKFIGRAGFTKRKLCDETDENIEIRYALLPEFWGKGYASELTLALIDYAKNQLKAQLISASCGLTNDKSDHILTKCGFKFIKDILPEGFALTSKIKYYELKF